MKMSKDNFQSISVRSFGTEDRPTDRPVPARDEIFEYIIFRGADIEDLQVREPPQSSLTQDPAIVEVCVLPLLHMRSNSFVYFQSSAYSDNARSNNIGTNTNLGGLKTTNQSISSTRKSHFRIISKRSNTFVIQSRDNALTTTPTRCWQRF